MSAIEKQEIQIHPRRGGLFGRERPRIETLCLLFLSLVGAAFVLRYAQAVIVPFILALLFFYALDPIVCWLCRRGIPRVVSSVLLILILLGTGASSIYMLGGQASAMVDRLPEAVKKVRTTMDSVRRAPGGAVAKVQQVAGELERTASNAGSKPVNGVTRVQIEEPLFRASDYLWSGSLGLLWLSARRSPSSSWFSFCWHRAISTKGSSLRSSGLDSRADG
jgi:predicted PurR-regulated permease PerM